MEKFIKIILSLCFLALITNVIEINQVRLQTKSPTEETILQKILYNFPKEIKFGQKYTNKDKLEFTIKDKNFTEKIVAPVAKISYNFWGEAFSENRYYAVKDKKNYLVLANVNVKNLSIKETDLDSLIQANVIYDNKYEFECFTYKITNDKKDFTADIKLMPLQSSDVYFISEVPKDFVNDKKAMTMEFKVNNTKYVVNLK